MRANEPDIDLRLDRSKREFEPGELLTGSFRVLRWQNLGLSAVELSVLWHTAGKGDEDIGVLHFFRVPLEPVPETDIANPQLFKVKLPASPLSYDGFIVKVRWLVRLRLFYLGGREQACEVAFRLGSVPTAQGLSTGDGAVAIGETAQP
ncbi:MAG: hypothetical protein WD851_12460 [Pirellulales bacterium]